MASESKSDSYAACQGCKSIAMKDLLCQKHGAYGVCKAPTCLAMAPNKSGLCVKHGARRFCSVDGCATPAQSKGLCWTHGGRMPSRTRSSRTSSRRRPTSSCPSPRHTPRTPGMSCKLPCRHGALYFTRYVIPLRLAQGQDHIYVARTPAYISNPWQIMPRNIASSQRCKRACQV